LIAGCAGVRPTEVRWDAPTPAFLRTWAERADSTKRIAYLAAAEFEAGGRHHSFTLELFYLDPDVYSLRGRGFLGATGFRARIHGDSLIVLLNREGRGYAGLVQDYPDSSVAHMWELMRLALPWLVGESSLLAEHESAWRVRLSRSGSAPEEVRVESDGKSLSLYYARQSSRYPFWQLVRAVGSSEDGRLALQMRQRLQNPDLDSSYFRLELPPHTRPLID
jgi:hypothetical protein